MLTLPRCTKLAARYRMTQRLETPGFHSFINPESGAGVMFFEWGNPRHTDGGTIPDGYVVILPFHHEPARALSRLCIRCRAWPARGLHAKTWTQVEGDIDRLVGAVLAEHDEAARIALVQDLPLEDLPDNYDNIALLREAA